MLFILLDASIQAFVPEGTVLGKRIGEPGTPGEPGSKKKKKKEAALAPKNPVMRLNELRSGLDFVVESQTGPVHAPVFVMRYCIKSHTPTLCTSLSHDHH